MLAGRRSSPVVLLSRMRLGVGHPHLAADSRPFEREAFLNRHSRGGEETDARGGELVDFFVHASSVGAACDRRGQAVRLHQSLAPTLPQAVL